MVVVKGQDAKARRQTGRAYSDVSGVTAAGGAEEGPSSRTGREEKGVAAGGKKDCTRGHSQSECPFPRVFLLVRPSVLQYLPVLSPFRRLT